MEIQYGDQGDGLWLEDPENPGLPVGADITATLSAHRSRWTWELTLDEEEYGKKHGGKRWTYETDGEYLELEEVIRSARGAIQRAGSEEILRVKGPDLGVTLTRRHDGSIEVVVHQYGEPGGLGAYFGSTIVREGEHWTA